MTIDAEELIATMTAQRGGRMEPAFAWMARLDPEFTAAFNTMVQQAFGLHGDGSPDTSVLSPKIKELITIAILASQKDFERMPHHLGRLIEWYGVTDREILETFQTVGTVAGGPTMRGGIAMYLKLKEAPGAATSE
jgi:alkylhydroperoxidase/carboxymuconolactone decarboxylase family protein YurZ